jgi:NAD(P)-dependent dehydrogenase (short-subunit alcohol dehydrogenase family)
MPVSYTLITGAAGGIGRSLAKRLAEDRPVLLHDLAGDALLEAAKECGGQAATWSHDLTDVAGVLDSLTMRLQEIDGVVDRFVHCAGVVKVLPVRSLDVATVEEVMNVNALSALQIVRSLCRKRINQGALRNVVFVSSIYALRGVKGQCLYSASKAALNGMTRSLAVELAPTVRVNSIVPGGVRTPMSEHVFQEEGAVAQLEKEYILRLGEVKDIVNGVDFLLSDKSSWMTGQELVVDGGKTVC